MNKQHPQKHDIMTGDMAFTPRGNGETYLFTHLSLLSFFAIIFYFISFAHES